MSCDLCKNYSQVKRYRLTKDNIGKYPDKSLNQVFQYNKATNETCNKCVSELQASIQENVKENQEIEQEITRRKTPPKPTYPQNVPTYQPTVIPTYQQVQQSQPPTYQQSQQVQPPTYQQSQQPVYYSYCMSCNKTGLKNRSALDKFIQNIMRYTEAQLDAMKKNANEYLYNCAYCNSYCSKENYQFCKEGPGNVQEIINLHQEFIGQIDREIQRRKEEAMARLQQIQVPTGSPRVAYQRYSPYQRFRYQ